VQLSLRGNLSDNPEEHINAERYSNQSPLVRTKMIGQFKRVCSAVTLALN